MIGFYEFPVDFKCGQQTVDQFPQRDRRREFIVAAAVPALIEKKKPFPRGKNGFQKQIMVLLIRGTVKAAHFSGDEVESACDIPAGKRAVVQSENRLDFHGNAPHRHQRAECDLAPQERFGGVQLPETVFEQMQNQFRRKCFRQIQLICIVCESVECTADCGKFQIEIIVIEKKFVEDAVEQFAPPGKRPFSAEPFPQREKRLGKLNECAQNFRIAALRGVQ